MLKTNILINNIVLVYDTNLIDGFPSFYRFMATKENKSKPVKKRYYRKRVRIFNLIDKIKLWPSRSGQLHGVRSIEIMGDTARLTTHCNKEFLISNSLNSRAGRWLRNKWFG